MVNRLPNLFAIPKTCWPADRVGGFHPGKFTPARAATWLAERGFKPLLFVPNSGRLTADFDAPSAQVRCAISGHGMKGHVDGRDGRPCLLCNLRLGLHRG